MALEGAELLYRELEGTLSAADDPSGEGSKANLFGYVIGGGAAGIPAKLSRLNAIRDNGDRIEVQRTTTKNQGPGKVSEPITNQLIKDTIVISEWRAVQMAIPQASENMTQEQADLRLATFLLAGSSDDSEFGLTDGRKSQLLAIFDGAQWNGTRDNILALSVRAGSRSEELTGRQYTAADLQAAEEWRVAQGIGGPNQDDPKSVYM